MTARLIQVTLGAGATQISATPAYFNQMVVQDNAAAAARLGILRSPLRPVSRWPAPAQLTPSFLSVLFQGCRATPVSSTYSARQRK